MKSLTTVKDEIKQELAQCRKRLQALQSQPGSPTSGAQIEATIHELEVKLSQFASLTVAPIGHLPRGMVARIALHFVGGEAKRYVSNVMCLHPGCQQMSKSLWAALYR